MPFFVMLLAYSNTETAVKGLVAFFFPHPESLLAFESRSKDGIFLLSNTIHSKSRPEFILWHEENLLIFPLSPLLEMYLFLN